MEKGISYTKRGFDEYKTSLRNFTEENYPEISKDFDDASVGAWLIDLLASVSDNLSYHTDRVYNETTMDAQQLSSVMAIARNNGVKIPGPKGAVTEVEFTCILPAISGGDTSGPDYTYAPTIKRNTKISSANQMFELMNDVDFKKQFDVNGVSNRIESKIKDKNYYFVSKKVLAIGGESVIYSLPITKDDIKPFFSVTIPDENVMGVEGIVVIDGIGGDYEPSINDFYNHNEFVSESASTAQKDTWNFFEVNSLVEQFRWADKSNADGSPVIYDYVERIVDESGNTYYADIACITKGEWKPIKQKFITEFNDNGYLTITFGQGNYADVPLNSTDFAKNQISKIINNNAMGVLPKSDTTMYILYRRGGGVSSNVAVNTINNIVSLNILFGEGCDGTNNQIMSQVRNSITVTNTIPSISGKDMPTIDEIKYLIKYNTMAQERCVTIKDYENRIMMLPSKYGTPFRVSVAEENNKIVIYLLGISSNGNLSDVLPSVMVSNISDYLSEYRMINDFVEIKSGRIINLSFDVLIYIDKKYDSGIVMSSVSDKIQEYMSVNNHRMGEDIYVGDLIKEISKIDGVINLSEIIIYNQFGTGYNQNRSSQVPYIYQNCTDEGAVNETFDTKVRLDLVASDYILKSDIDTMFEIKYGGTDINIRAKTN